MEISLREHLEKLLKAYSHKYDITPNVTENGVVYPAIADFFFRDENYAFSKKAVISAYEQHDYAYFYLADHLDADAAKDLLDRTLQTGMARIRPHKEHKSSYVSLVILANTITPEAQALIKKTRFQKNFLMTLHGWMEYHIAAMEISTNCFLSNPAGKGIRKTLELNFGSRDN